MKKFVMIAVAVVAVGLISASAAYAGCGSCPSGNAASAPAAAAPQVASGTRSYRSFSYEPRYGRSMMGGYRMSNPGYSASRKVLGN